MKPNRSAAVVLTAICFLVSGIFLFMNAQTSSEQKGSPSTTDKSQSSDAPAKPAKTELVTVGGGCFWCTEAVFEKMDGVKGVVSGYAGGQTENPNYKEICTGTTGHAEVIQIEFDPAKVALEKLLSVFWRAHNPTTLNRQGADTGTQYRSTIMFHSEEQKKIAEKSKAEAQKELSEPIVTEIVPLKKFYPAEDYHQDYFRKNPTQGYCQAVIRPKLNKLEKDKVIPAGK